MRARQLQWPLAVVSLVAGLLVLPAGAAVDGVVPPGHVLGDARAQSPAVVATPPQDAEAPMLRMTVLPETTAPVGAEGSVPGVPTNSAYGVPARGADRIGPAARTVGFGTPPDPGRGADGAVTWIEASLSGDYVYTYGFAAYATVTLTVRGAPGGTILASQSKPASGSGSASFYLGIDLVAGMQATATDGTTTKVLTLPALAITSVNAATDVVAGTAPAGAQVEVDIYGPPGSVGKFVTADAQSRWSANFAGLFDITSATTVSVSTTDEDGDATTAYKAAMRIGASLTYDYVSVSGAVAQASVSFTVYDSAGGPVLTSGAATANGYGYASFSPGIDLVAGMQITATDGSSTKDLTLPALAIASIDPAADIVAGTAPANAQVEVEVYANARASKSVTADSNGNWATDFSGAFDITPTTTATAYVSDDDGDGTSVDKQPTRIEAWLSDGYIQLNAFAANASVTLTVRQSVGGTVLASSTETTSGTGSAMFRFPGVNLAAGMQITATDGTNSKELTLAALAIISVNPASEIVTGTAPPGAQVQVSASYSPGKEVSADAAGHWSADFGGVSDITYTTTAYARVSDGDGDTTSTSRQPTRIDASLSYNQVAVYGFAPNASVTFTIRQSAGGSVLASRTGPTSGNGSAYFYPAVSLAAGMEVSATDGTTTRSLTLAPLAISLVNPAGDVVTGTAAAGAQILVDVYGTSKTVIADDAGNWSAEFSGLYDITYSMGATAYLIDEDGDTTSAGKSPPAIYAYLAENYISASGFAGNTAVSFAIRESAGGTVLTTGSRQANKAGSTGSFSPGIDLVAGMQVTATDGTTSKELTLAPLSITSVNAATDVVAGTAPANAHLMVAAGGYGIYVYAQADGSWSANLSGTVDITPTMTASAYLSDDDGDTTSNTWAADVRFSASSYTVSEAAGSVEVTVQRIGSPPVSVSVSYSTADGSATAGSDYTSTSGSLSFPAGMTARTFTVPIINDGDEEQDETLRLTLSSPRGGAALTNPFTTTITITDDDNTLPLTTVISGPVGLTKDVTPSFAFSADEQASFECRVDEAPFAGCTSPHTTGALTDGAHVFEVRAIDIVGNVGRSASRTFTIDGTAPATAIDSGPSGLTSDSTPSFNFSANEPATFACHIDDAGFAPCTSPYTTAVLTDGTHVFEVRATDTAGNTGTATSRSFSIDAIAPALNVTGAASGSSYTLPSLPVRPTFAPTDSGSGIASSHDDWTTPGTSNGAGTYTYTATATDQAGNTSSDIRTYTVAAPLKPSAVKPVIGKPVTVPKTLAAGKNATVSFTVTRSDNGKKLTAGTMICDPSIKPKVIAHREQFKNGTATLRLAIPKTAKGKQLKVHLTIKYKGQTANRTSTFRIK